MTKTKEESELKQVTIRLQKKLVKDLKKMAKAEGKRYQTYIRDYLFAYVKKTKEINKVIEEYEP